MIMVEARNDQSLADCEKSLRDLLYAQVASHERRVKSPIENKDRIVRHYILSPNPLVKDPVAKLRTGRLEAVMGDQIDAFLLASGK